MSPRRPIDAVFPSLRNMGVTSANRGLSTAGRLMGSPATSTANIADIRNAFARQGLQAGALDAAKRQSTVESARDRAMRALGALPEASAAQTRAKLIEPTTAASGLGSMLPQRGTPGSAALGAFGQTMSQLGGWQDKPMTFGQILGASLGKAREAYSTAEEKQAAIAEKKAAAELAAEQEKYKREQEAKKFSLEERKTVAQERTDIDELFAGGERLGLKGADLINFVKEQLAKKKGGTDVSVTIGKDGEPIMSLDKQQIKEQQDNVVKSVGTQDLLLDIQETFDEKYLQIPERINQVWLAGKDKFGMAKPSEQEDLREFSRFKQNAIEAVNQYIRDITGAQMSVKEAERLSLALPQPGQGIFDGDSPAVFQEKLKNAIEKVKRAEQRAKYFLSEGIDISYDYKQRESETLDADFETDAQFKMNGKTIRLNDMPRIINKKGAEIEKELIEGGMDAEAAVKEAAIRVKEIFG